MIKVTIDNFISIILLLFVVIISFTKGNSANIGNIWEDIAVFTTIAYAAAIYIIGFFSKSFDGLSRPDIGWITLALIVIGFMTKDHIQDAWNYIFNDSPHIEYISRTIKMRNLLIMSALFTFIDFKMMKKAQNNKINYASNFWYSDFPVTIIFGILFALSIKIGDETIKKNSLDLLFQGAIAFQLLLSNIIWIYNDDKFWKTLIR